MAAIVMGDFLLDIFIETQEKFNFGTDTHAKTLFVPGGSGANVAWWLGMRGIRTHLIAKIGEDPFGDFLVQDLAQAQVDLVTSRSAQQRTGTCLVINDIKGERSMITDRGANVDLTPGDLLGLETLFTGCSLFHLSGYALYSDPPREASLEALRLARAAGAKISFDPSNHLLIQRFGPKNLLDFIEMWEPEFVWPNLEEARVMTGHSDPEQAGAVLNASGAKIAVIKLGAEGLVVVTEEQSIPIPTLPIRAIDTTGAGDACCGAFIAAYLETGNLEQAGFAGVKAGSSVVTGYGSRPAQAGKELR